MRVGIYDFARILRRPIETIGSSMWRAQWIWENWDEAESYVEGRKYDAVIFQKVHLPKVWRAMDCVKILDLCDPVWIQEGREHIPNIVEESRYFNAITVSSEGLKNALENYPLHCPVYWIDDRIDFKYIEKRPKKKHKGTIIGYMGYSNNGQSAIQEVTPYLYGRDDVTVKFITNHPVNLDGVQTTHAPFDWKTLADELAECDFVLNPPVASGLAHLKSKNKTYLAWAHGLPVAHNSEEMLLFMDPIEREKAIDKFHGILSELDILKSIEVFKTIIKQSL